MAGIVEQQIAFEMPGGTPSPEKSVCPIDFDQLSRQTFGDRALEQEVLGLFCQQAKQTMDVLDRADGAERFRLVHSLKGSARSIGAFNLASICEQVEKSPGDSDLLCRLDDEIVTVCDFVASISR